MSLESTARASYRGQITRLSKAALDFLKSPDSQINNESADFDNIEEELQSYLQRLTTAHESLCSVNNEMREKNLLKSDEIEREYEKIADYEDTAINVISRLKVRLSKVQNKLHGMPTATESKLLPTKEICTKLERLKLKKFSGDHKEWISFWQQFRTAVHENRNLSSVEKFHYLQTVLTGAAEKTIEGFTPSDECYDSAISLLQEEYGKPEKLIDMTVQQLMALPHPHSRNDIARLRRLYNNVVSGTRSLKALNVPTAHYSIMLKTILLKAFPIELRIEYHRLHDKEEQKFISQNFDDHKGESASAVSSSVLSRGDAELQSILKFLKCEVESLERAGVTETTKPVHAARTRHAPTTAAGLITTNDMHFCQFCKSKEHATRDCDDGMLTIESKKELLRKNGMCFRCLSMGHRSKFCRYKNLVCKKCSGRHATCMCDPTYKAKTSNGVLNEKLNLNNKAKTVSLCTYRESNEPIDVFLQTARVFAISPLSNAKIFVRIIIDSGSQRTYIRESVANKLKLPIVGTVKMNILPFGSASVNNFEEYRLVSVKLKDKNQINEICVTAIVVPIICADVLPVPNENATLFDNLDLADVNYGNCDVEDGLSLLIGADYFWKVTTTDIKRITDGLSIVKTIFGWTLHGACPVSMSMSKGTKVSPVLASTVLDESNLSKLWELDVLGIKPDALEQNEMTSELQQKCIVKRNERYEASLPWKGLNVTLEINKEIAFNRLKSLLRKLSRNPKNLLDYDQAMNEMIQSGVAELVSNEEGGRNQYYMPHRPVYRLDKTTTKLRIVFDASSHAHSALSLNDHLHTGANLLPDILKIILNFRFGKIGIIADIEKAFLQLSLKEEDRDSHRFIWFSKAIESTNNLPTFSTYRMTRVTFGVRSSPFLLSAAILKHLDAEAKNFSQTCSILRNSFYMDDLILSTDNEESAKRIYAEGKELMQRASMRLRKWNSNAVEVRKIFDDTEIPVEQKVLGIRWNTISDEISPCLDSLVEFVNGAQEGTKRSVLQTISRIYDPLGALGPVTIALKILFQDIWKFKLDWDIPLPDDLRRRWKCYVNELLLLNEAFIPRNVYLSSQVSNIQAHIFADASQRAYGIVAFIRNEDLCKNVSVRFLCAKSRVAPLKENENLEITLPRLELTAALIAARLKLYLTKSLNISIGKFFFWSDSKITLHWIRGDRKKWKPYVSNRVNEIRELTNIEDWRHCPGMENPADLLTRGVTAAQLMRTEKWAQGPEWLSKGKTEWPIENENLSHLPIVLATLLSTEISTCERVPVLMFENFSCWRRLLRVTGYVLRFVNRVHHKIESPTNKILLTREIKAAEIYWLKYVQITHFSNEIVSFQMGKNLSSSSKIFNLNPIVDDDGMLRVGGRLHLLDETMNNSHPIILPDCYITKLIIDDAHQRTLHSGVNLTLTKLRERFWIIRGRQLIKKAVKKCRTCRRIHVKPLTQPFAPLPKDRLRLVRPFGAVGIDFAGPLYVKDKKGDPPFKIYFLIFTCAAIRSIHLEMTLSLTTESCLLAIRRFIARRGIPSTIYSDNAKTFKCASREVKELAAIIENETFMNFMVYNRIEWKFIVDRAPWWGGFWERLIRNVKGILKVTIGRSTLNLEQLSTLVIEAENIVNERPLTYISDDPLDLTPLTPNSILKGFGNLNQQCDDDCSTDITAKELRKTLQIKTRSISYLAKRWKNEYLQLLRAFHNTGKSFITNVQPGDVVLLHDRSAPRIHWKMAVIDKVFPGRDNRIRACEIRLSNGTILRRPIQLLYPLEMQNFAGPEDVVN